MTLEDLVAIIAETGVVPNIENFNVETTFEVNGVDSLDTYTIILAVEEKTGVSLEDVALEEINSANAMHAYIVANKP